MKNKNIKEIRLLLNDFFQNVDTEAKIETDVANAIVDVHLKKFTNLIQAEKEQYLEIIDLVQTIMGNGTMVVETVNESILVKLMENIGKPILVEKTYRDIEKDFEQFKKESV